jgi:cyanophycinase
LNLTVENVGASLLRPSCSRRSWHFTQRDRFSDMTALTQRYPQLLGIGIDESTALIMRGQIAEVVGRTRACFYDRRQRIQEGKPDYESVAAGGRYDLVQRKVLHAGDINR